MLFRIRVYPLPEQVDTQNFQILMATNRRNEQLHIWLPFLLAVVLALGIMIGLRMEVPGPVLDLQKVEDGRAQLYGKGKVEELVRYIEAKYVDSVDANLLLDEAIESVLKELDPHSSYIPKDELQKVNEQLEGNFNGIGVEFMMVEDTVVVVAPLSGGPSEAVGIQSGDQIIEVEDSLIAGVSMSNDDVIQLLRGDSGSRVHLKIKRKGQSGLLKYEIIRDKIPVNSVDAGYMLDEKVGYIKINRFSASTDHEFIKSVMEMIEEEGMEDLVIDLRHNPGGYLQKATNLLSQLYSGKGQLLVYTEGRSTRRNEYESNGRNHITVDEVVVLIDEGSASASEIVAGAIQDTDRGLVVGRRSFGKGLVQEQYPLSDGSALRLTVARYYTPSGRSIQKPYEDREAYDNDFIARLDSGELITSEEIEIQDSTRYFTLDGRVVYGGGGIVPDIFVPIDTLLLKDAFVNLRQHIPTFTFKYVQEESEVFQGMSEEVFVERFQPDDQLMSTFRTYAEEENQLVSDAEWQDIYSALQRSIGAHLARRLYGEGSFHKFWNRDDAAIRAALRALEKPITEK